MFWIARDKKDNKLVMFASSKQPVRAKRGIFGFGYIGSDNIWKCKSGFFIGYFDDKTLPDFAYLTWNHDPVEVILVDKNKQIDYNYDKFFKELEDLKYDNENLNLTIEQITTLCKHLKQKISKLCNPTDKKYKNNVDSKR